MNCRAAQRLISAERDGALSSRERASLEAHVAGCPECTRARASLAAAATAWKSADQHVATPDVERAWMDIRREIRRGRDYETRAGAGWWLRALRVGLPVAGVAAVALTVFLGRPRPVEAESTAASWAQFVQVDAADAAPVITVDESSGWVVVWTEDAGGGHS
ncbi:MAG: zf-HC2 domain-containing protein [Opitutaceae bacterium]|nr:zf-HC2 domain-containing protein [Opitutaceae bacterium]